MSTPNYTTQARVQEFLNETIEVGKAEQAIASAEKIIENITGRKFKADTSASARTFDGNGAQELSIDDCVEITLVEAANDYYGDSRSTITAGGVNGYLTLPTSRVGSSGIMWPIRKLHLRGGIWLAGIGNHRITAKWGFSTTPPDDVVFAATVLAGGIYKYGRGGSIGNIKSEKIDKYSVAYADEKEWAEYNKAMIVLDGYKKFYL